MTTYRGIIIVVFVGAVIPLSLWARDVIFSSLFSNSYNVLSTVAQMSGLVGLSLYSVNILLSARYHAIDRLFFGLDRAYRVHRMTGIVAFSLMITHVAAVSIRAATLSAADFTLLWIDTSITPFTYGHLAFYGFTSIIFITLFVKHMRYEHLKRLHQMLGVFLFLGGVHAYLIPSDIAVNMPLRVYVLSLVTLGVASYTVRTLLKSWLVPRRTFIVKAVERLSSDITEVTMVPQASAPFSFMPGQFNFYRFLQHGFPSEDHPFSITAGNTEHAVRISAKNLGDFTALLPKLKPGARVLVQGPFGGFSYQRGSKKQLWIAGGIGITPFISMARSLASSSDPNPYDITLIHSVKSEEEAVYREELENIAEKFRWFTFHLWVSDHKGFLTASAVSDITSISDKDIFVCGPPAMMHALIQQFHHAGIPRARIKSERFTLL